jgi:predicted Zn-dependent protease
VTRAPAVLALALAGCVAPSVQLPARDRPGVAIDEDEQRMWRVAEEGEKSFADSGRLLADPALDAYLLDVARRLEPPQVLEAIRFRFHVVRDTHPGAFALPTGAVYVYTGMLARMESEAELATLLGHEMAHVVQRHALRQARQRQGWMPDAFGLIRLASVTGYSRELEAEADREGVLRMKAAGYDTADAPRFFQRLHEWATAEDLKAPPTYYSTHPRIEERIESSRELARSLGGSGGRRDEEVYARKTAGVLLVNARVELAAGRYAAARDQAQRYVHLAPSDAAGHLALAETARREAKGEWMEAALSGYRKAIELDPKGADAWRGLGLVLSKKGDDDEARKAYRRYLEVAPDAPDRAHVEAALGRDR